LDKSGSYPEQVWGDMQVLIAVKTYPIPSKGYDELVCTAGVTETGDFVRLYPINFRDLPWDQQYRKYQWIEVEVKKHVGRDSRKESYRPDSETLQIMGEPLDTKDNWSKRAHYLLKKEAQISGGPSRAAGSGPYLAGRVQTEANPRSGYQQG